MKCSLPAAVYFSVVRLGACVVMPWLEWCPDPHQPDPQWVKVFHPGTWTLHAEHDEPPPRHTYREWKMFRSRVHFQDGVQSTVHAWYQRDWATEGYRRVYAPELDKDPASIPHPDQRSVATQSSVLTISPQVLDAILRFSDASTFSTALSHPCAGRDQPTTCGSHAPSMHYMPTDRPCSLNVNEKSIFELVAE